jgi:hypothetical protein
MIFVSIIFANAASFLTRQPWLTLSGFHRPNGRMRISPMTTLPILSHIQTPLSRPCEGLFDLATPIFHVWAFEC